MKPNHKDSLPQVSSKKTACIGTTTTTAAANSTNEAHVSRNYNAKRLQSLCENVTIIGWMGIIASTTLLLCSGLTIQFCNEIVRHLAHALRKSVEVERTRVMMRRVVILVSTSVYFLSAVNALMNMFLLFGVARLKYKLMLPWLLFHGFLFGLFVHLALYMIITSLLVDLRIFVILFASFTLILMIFYKVSYEVFLLHRCLRGDSVGLEDKRLLRDEENKNTYLILQSEA